MGLFKNLLGSSNRRQSASGFQSQSKKPPSQETFILEPILTPSGLVDGGDDSPDPIFIESELPDEIESELEEEVETASEEDLTPVELSNLDEVDEVEIPFITELEELEIEDNSETSEENLAESNEEIISEAESLSELNENSETEIIETTLNTSPEVNEESSSDLESSSEVEEGSTENQNETVSSSEEISEDSTLEEPEATASSSEEISEVSSLEESPTEETASELEEISEVSTLEESTTEDVETTTEAELDESIEETESSTYSETEDFNDTDTVNESENETDSNGEILEEIVSSPIDFNFDSGIFTVGETGEIGIDYLFDGGGFGWGEVAIFSLEGMEELDLSLEGFIQEASNRALSDSELGHVVISDGHEGAKFSGGMGGEADVNRGEYLGVKTFNMRPGDKFAMMLIPNGKVQQVFDNPNAEGNIRPLFSLSNANPEDGFQLGQIADVTGDGNTFVFEDLRVDNKSDHDYNDIIFQVRGASGEAVHLDEVVNPNKDWRSSDMGQALIEYAQPYITPDEPIVEIENNLSNLLTDLEGLLDEGESETEIEIDEEVFNSEVVETEVVDEIVEVSEEEESQDESTELVESTELEVEESEVVEIEDNLDTSIGESIEVESEQTEVEESVVSSIIEETDESEVIEIADNLDTPVVEESEVVEIADNLDTPVVEEFSPDLEETESEENLSTAVVEETEQSELVEIEDSGNIPIVQQTEESNATEIEDNLETSIVEETEESVVIETENNLETFTSPTEPRVIDNSSENLTVEETDKFEVVEIADNSETFVVEETEESEVIEIADNSEISVVGEVEESEVIEIADNSENPVVEENLSTLTVEEAEESVVIEAEENSESSTSQTEPTVIDKSSESSTIVGEVEESKVIKIADNSETSVVEEAKELEVIEIADNSETSVVEEVENNLETTLAKEAEAELEETELQEISEDSFVEEIEQSESVEVENNLDNSGVEKTEETEFIDVDKSSESSTLPVETTEFEDVENNFSETSPTSTFESPTVTVVNRLENLTYNLQNQSLSETPVNSNLIQQLEQLTNRLITQTENNPNFAVSTNTLQLIERLETQLVTQPVLPTSVEPSVDFEFPAENQPLIGIIDTGFSGDNPDIDYSRITWGSDKVDGDADPTLSAGEGNEHGTHVLGLIAAKQDNGIGIDGINNNAPIWAGRAIGSGRWAESLVEFVDAAVESGQPNAVVNLSLDLTQIDAEGNVTTRYEFTPLEMAALEYARQNNILVAVAAGNEGGVMSALGQASQQFDNIITVGAAERVNDAIAVPTAYEPASYSGSGDALDIVADGNSGSISSTTVATAKVTGTISQVWAANSDLNYTQVIDIIKRTATDLAQPNWDSETGAGLLNIAAAVHLAKATKPEPDIANYLEVDKERKIPLGLPDIVWFTVQRAENLANYDPLDLASTRQWVVRISSDEDIQKLSALVNANLLGATGYITNTYVLEFPGNISHQNIQKQLQSLESVEFAYPLVSSQQQSRFVTNDSLFEEQWHLKNQGQSGGTSSEDVNIYSAWNLGLTGKQIVIGIVDDGLQHTHPDLQPNYRTDLSRDFNEQMMGGFGTYDHDPAPVNAWESHGTSVAGVAAAKGNNQIGVTGAAPNAFLAGLRLTAGASTDLMEADALSYLNNNIHIYNNSWGPVDDGRTKKAPNPLAAMALHIGATQGRQGLGNVYVWAGGNGKESKDNVNYDGYANSRYTIAVAAIDHNGKQAFYSEPGASLLVSAHSNGNSSGITTTDLLGDDGANQGDYTNSFGGTSAAAPLVSGVIALMLEANPSLTWRDVQKILIDTARQNDPSDADWKLNGGGRWVNHKYGFGAIDAGAAVSLAKSWQPLETEVAISSGLISINSAIPDNNRTSRVSVLDITEDITVETVEVMFDAQHALRGDLDVRLISPDGTVSILAERHDDTGDNYDHWVFTSTRHWGESSQGEWKLQVTDRRTGTTGLWDSWQLNLYGTQPTVSIESTVPDAAEGGQSGEFTVTRTGNTKNPLTINYEFGQAIHWSQPSATNGEDFEFLSGTVTIPAGSSSAKIPIIPIDDEEVEWTETVTLNLTTSDGYEVSSDSSATVKIFDNEKSRVQVFAEWGAATPGPWHRTNYTSESGNTGSFLFRRLGDIREELTVDYSMAGTATNGVDYKYLPGFITIAAGSYDASTMFIPIDDGEEEEEETTVLTVNPSSTYDILPEWGLRETVILDNDNKPTVNIFASQPNASEYGQPGQFTITRTGDTSQPLTVNYWEREWWLRGTPGEDYEPIPGTTMVGKHLDGTVIIPAGESSVNIDVIPIDDNLVEPTDRVRFFLRSSQDYAIGRNEQAIVNITDNDTPKIEWQRQIGTSGYDYSESVTLDSFGNVYIAGRTSGNLAGTNLDSYDAWLAKYDDNGTELWKQQLGTSGYDTAKSIVADGAGNTYVAGWTDGSFDGNLASRDAWLAKYNPHGHLIWRKKLEDSSTTHSVDYDISNGSLALGNDGSLYLTGLTHGNLAGTSQGDADAWVAKYDGNGNQQWVQQLGTPQRDEARGVAVDLKGYVYITGQTKGALEGVNQGDADAWIAKYNSQGSLIWKQQLGTQAEDVSNGISIDSNGNVYIAGHTRSKLGDPLTGKFNELGDHRLRWAAIHGDQSGLGGTYYGNADAWVAQYDSNGNLNWKRQLGTSQYDSASAVATDRFGNVYITGRTRGKLGQTHAGGDDVWVTKYNVNGALQWIQQLGTVGEDVSNSIAVGSTALYITGSTSGSLSSANKGGDDAWLIKLS
ncbi:MAG: S8 family serine peptidase [Limnoraphis sp.]